MEPYRLRRWRTGTSPSSISFFTCARPGRSKGADQPVSDQLIDQWVHGLPGTKTAIVSLLGRKNGPEGLSEFSFYPFFGGFDTPAERRRRPSFQEWLALRYGDRDVSVREHPTYDFCVIPTATVEAVLADILELGSAGYTVVVVDSGGQTRTSTVCKRIGATEDSRRI